MKLALRTLKRYWFVTLLIWMYGCAQKSNPVTSNQVPLPVRLSNIVSTPGIPVHFTVHNDTAYIADFNAGLAKVELVGTPSLITPNVPITSNLLSTREIVWVGFDTLKGRVIVGQRESTSSNSPRYLYYVDNDSFKIMEGGDVSTSVYLSLFYDQDTTLRSMRCNLDSDGYNLYSLNYIYDEGLQIWYWAWVSSPPNYISPMPYARVRQAIWEKPYSFSACEEYGLVVLQQSSYSSPPIEIGSVDLPSVSYWVAKKDSIVYVALNDRGVAVISVSQVNQPQLLRIIPIRGSSRIQQVEVSSDKKFLYALDIYDGVYVLSLTNSVNPAQLGLLSAYSPNFMLVYRNELFVVDGSQGLLIYK